MRERYEEGSVKEARQSGSSEDYVPGLLPFESGPSGMTSGRRIPFRVALPAITSECLCGIG